MKKFTYVLLAIAIAVSCLTLAGCEALSNLLGGGGDNSFTKSYEPITGKFYLYSSPDARVDCSNTYFDIDGTKGNFSLKYYENGALKKQGVFRKILTRPEKIGYWSNNLHFNVKCDDGSFEHIGTYTESFEPIDQFRIIEEYNGTDDTRYFYSELPFALGTYVRQGKDFVPESANKNNPDLTNPTLDNYTYDLNGKYQMDEEHYFYFVNPFGYVIKDGPLMDAYFQYYAPGLDKPLEGFAHGVTYKDSIAPPRLFLTYSLASSYYDSLEDTEKLINFKYVTFDANDRMVDHYGSLDFSEGHLQSFTFEHLSRSWTEDEWDEYTKSETATLPDAIIYEYVGGTYYKQFD